MFCISCLNDHLDGEPCDEKAPDFKCRQHLEQFVDACLGCWQERSAIYEAALRAIKQGCGPYDQDRLSHAGNTIEAMKEIAVRALGWQNWGWCKHCKDRTMHPDTAVCVVCKAVDMADTPICSKCDGDLNKEGYCPNCNWTCDYCGRDCRGWDGTAAPGCRRAHNAGM